MAEWPFERFCSWAFEKGGRASTAWGSFGFFMIFMALLHLMNNLAWDKAQSLGMEVKPPFPTPYGMMPDAPWGAFCPEHGCNGSHCSPSGLDTFPKEHCDDVMAIFNFSKCVAVGQDLGRLHRSHPEMRGWFTAMRIFDATFTQQLAPWATAQWVAWGIRHLWDIESPKHWYFKCVMLLIVWGFVGDVLENLPQLYFWFKYPEGHDDEDLYKVVCFGAYGKLYGLVGPCTWCWIGLFWATLWRSTFGRCWGPCCGKRKAA
mmetsp:Transcript_2219/g.4969  ORF Transcript_2219/g.4969 Transcript_2219/m.4969 type:complete len:260 (+) Transcript_2219:79-858(+)